MSRRKAKRLNHDELTEYEIPKALRKNKHGLDKDEESFKHKIKPKRKMKFKKRVFILILLIMLVMFTFVTRKSRLVSR